MLTLVHGNRPFTPPCARPSNRLTEEGLIVYEGFVPKRTGEVIQAPAFADWTNDTVHEVMRAMQAFIGPMNGISNVNTGRTKEGGKLYIRIGDFDHRSKRVVFVGETIPESVRNYLLLHWTHYTAFIERLASGPKRRFWQSVPRRECLVHFAPVSSSWNATEAQRAIGALERFMKEQYPGEVMLCLSERMERASLGRKDKRCCRCLTVNAMVGSIAARMRVGTDIDLPADVLSFIETITRAH